MSQPSHRPASRLVTRAAIGLQHSVSYPVLRYFRTIQGWRRRCCDDVLVWESRWSCLSKKSSAVSAADRLVHRRFTGPKAV